MIYFPNNALTDEIFIDENGQTWICTNSPIDNPGTSYIWARLGAQGNEGPQGEIGPEGPQGPEGPPGEGIQLMGSVETKEDLPGWPNSYSGDVGDAYTVIFSGDLWVWDADNIWNNAGHIVGAEGAEGPQGEKGDPGPKGDDGADGSQGIAGDKGDTGADGTIGAVGPPGIPGNDGADGAPGVDGTDGTDGAQGIPGNDGVDGADGAQGIPGNDGADGADSTVAGPEGPEGPQGIQGDQGASVVIKGTDTWANISSIALPEVNDMWIMSEVTGAPDSGSGAAQVGDGVTWAVAGVFSGKAGETWINVGPVRGPKGEQGLPGTDGTDGADSTVEGPQGPSGNDGADGLPGADGVDGAQGADGLPGADGVDGAQGIPGNDGADSIVEGPEGPEGPQGIPGIDGSSGAGTHHGDTEPVDPIATPNWFETSTGRAYTWYEDGDSGQWVQTTAEVELSGVGVFEEAPVDGTPYARQDSGWVAVSSGGVGGALDWEYLLVNQETQLVDGDAVAAEVVDSLLNNTHLYLPPTQAGYSLSGEVMTIAGSTTAADACVNIDSDGNPVAYDGDFVFEAQVSEMASVNGSRGIQVGTSPDTEDGSTALVTVYYHAAGMGAAIAGSAFTPVVNTSSHGGLIRIEAVGAVLTVYIDDKLEGTGVRPAGDLYMKLWGDGSWSGPISAACEVTAIRAGVPSPSSPKLLLPVSSVDNLDNVDILDFAGAASVSNPIVVQSSVPRLVDIGFVPPTQAGYSLNGNVMTIAQGTTAGDVCPYKDSSGNPLAFGGDFIFEAQVGEITTCDGIRGIEVGHTPEWESTSGSVAGINTYRVSNVSRLDGGGTGVTSFEINPYSGAGVMKIVAQGASLEVYVDDVLKASGTRPVGDLYLKLWGHYHGSYAYGVSTTVTGLQPQTAFETGDGPYIFGQANYNITTPRSNLRFISPTGTESWTVLSHSGWDSAALAAATPLRDKLKSPSTGTTDIGDT